VYKRQKLNVHINIKVTQISSSVTDVLETFSSRTPKVLFAHETAV
jgi:hypothetical protein